MTQSKLQQFWVFFGRLKILLELTWIHNVTIWCRYRVPHYDKYTADVHVFAGFSVFIPNGLCPLPGDPAVLRQTTRVRLHRRRRRSCGLRSGQPTQRSSFLASSADGSRREPSHVVGGPQFLLQSSKVGKLIREKSLVKFLHALFWDVSFSWN